jgi:hypothetical protein
MFTEITKITIATQINMESAISDIQAQLLQFVANSHKFLDIFEANS